MKFLHTGDWHVGKALRSYRRDDEYEAVLAEILDVAKREQVDAILVAGDVFDTSSPSAEAERLVYEFFSEAAGSHIHAVVIGGNHDHPKRLEAIRPLLRVVGVEIRGDAVTPDAGGVLQLPSRDKAETATIAVLPWVQESRVVEFEHVMAGEARPHQAYADGLANLIRILGARFDSGAVNVLLGHLFVSGSFVGKDGGERPIHLGQAFAVAPQVLPSSAQYVALGHIHRGQQITAAPCPTYYSGSPMQLDFGEAGQQKSVIVVEARAGLPADVQRVPITSGRALRDVEGTLEQLAALAPEVGNAFLRVLVRIDEPVLSLADRVREILPNAVEIKRVRTVEEPGGTDPRLSLGPEDLLREFYRLDRGSEVPDGVVSLFNRLYQEEYREADPA